MIPEKVQRRADEVLARYYAREISPKRLRGFGKVVAFSVGYSWRLVSWDGGETWDLLSHEQYNNKTRGRRQRLQVKGKR